MACAIVTEAGTPQCCCAAIAPGAIRLMNACCVRACGGAAVSGAAYFRYGPGRASAAGLCAPLTGPAATETPGIAAAASAAAPTTAPVPAPVAAAAGAAGCAGGVAGA